LDRRQRRVGINEYVNMSTFWLTWRIDVDSMGA
jgi:hypothetical protein